jgi:hypothetical protein
MIGLTVSWPEALGRLNKNIRKKTSKTISEQLGANQSEDGNSGILKYTYVMFICCNV